MVKLASEIKHGLERNRKLVEYLIAENKQLRGRLGKLEVEMGIMKMLK